MSPSIFLFFRAKPSCAPTLRFFWVAGSVSSVVFFFCGDCREIASNGDVMGGIWVVDCVYHERVGIIEWTESAGLGNHNLNNKKKSAHVSSMIRIIDDYTYTYSLSRPTSNILVPVFPFIGNSFRQWPV